MPSIFLTFLTCVLGLYFSLQLGFLFDSPFIIGSNHNYRTSNLLLEGPTTRKRGPEQFFFQFKTYSDSTLMIDLAGIINARKKQNDFAQFILIWHEISWLGTDV